MDGFMKYWWAYQSSNYNHVDVVRRLPVESDGRKLKTWMSVFLLVHLVMQFICPRTKVLVNLLNLWTVLVNCGVFVIWELKVINVSLFENYNWIDNWNKIDNWNRIDSWYWVNLLNYEFIFKLYHYRSLLLHL